MNASVLGEFGMEGGGHYCSLANRNWIFIAAFGGNDFDARADALDFGGADEDHFQRGICVVFLDKPAFSDGAVDLAAVGIATKADVDSAQAGLLRVFHFPG